jgi:hypothetical protein
LTGNIVFHTKWSGELIIDVGLSDGTMLMDFPADSFPASQANANKEDVAMAIGVSKDKIVDINTSKHCGNVVIEVDQSINIESLKVETFSLVIPSLFD